MKQTLKSIGAGLTGFLTVAILSVLTDVLIEHSNIVPKQYLTAQNGTWIWWMLLIALIYRCVYTILGGYIIAKLAPQKPMKHVMIVAYIGTAFALLGAIAMWDLGNHWYPILLVITAIPCMWLGGKLALKAK